MSRQSEIDKMTRLIVQGDYTDIGAFLVDNGIGTKDRFYGFTASGQKEIPQIKPIDYTI